MSLRLETNFLEVKTPGRMSLDISSRLQDIVAGGGIDIGLCTIFIEHTSASLFLCENADPDVQRDLEAFMSKLVPDGDPMFEHSAEGPDDMPAHIRSVLTQSSIGIPVREGRLALGTWQGVFLWEHRLCPHVRKISVTVVGY